MVKTGISAALLALVLVTSPFIFSSFKPVYAFHQGPAQVPDEEDSNLFFPASEFERERRAPTAALEALSPNLTGEQISLADGSVSFALDEFSLSTNMAMPISLRRRYQRLSGLNHITPGAMGDWQLDLPRISSTALRGDTRYTPNFQPESACSSLLSAGPIRAALGQHVEQHEYWNGADITIPHLGGGKILKGAGQGYRTTDNMRIHCETKANGNQYFIVRVSNGSQYQLGQRQVVRAKSLKRGNKFAGRYVVTYLVTLAQDRYGNQQFYEYDDEGRLTAIDMKLSGGTRQDLVKLHYEQGRVERVELNPDTSETQTWQYEYRGQNLYKVVQPSGLFWQYEFPTYDDFAADILPKQGVDDGQTQQAYCMNEYKGSEQGTEQLRVTHPYGTVVDYHLTLTKHGRTEVPAHWVMKQPNGHYLYNVNTCYSQLSLSQKQMRYSGQVDTWTYAFSNQLQQWDTQQGVHLDLVTTDSVTSEGKAAACEQREECSQLPELAMSKADLRVLTITQPNGNKQRHFISKRWDHTEGKVMATQWLNANDESLQLSESQYEQGSHQGMTRLNDGIRVANISTLASASHLVQKQIQQNGTRYTTQYRDFNAYGVPRQTRAFTDVEGLDEYAPTERLTKQSYYHDTEAWLLNLPRQTEVKVGEEDFAVTKRVDYYSKHHSEYPNQVYQVWAFGKRQKTFATYTNTGQVSRIEYNQTKRTDSDPIYLQFNRYHRGKPQQIKQARRYLGGHVLFRQRVDNLGRVTEQMDMDGVKTQYGYDDAGRLRYIDYQDDSTYERQWHDTLFIWDDSNLNDLSRVTYHCPLAVNEGEIEQAEQQACIDASVLQVASNFDQRLREIQVSQWGKETTRRYKRMAYDSDNRTTFSSIWSASNTESRGTSTQYDALGRVKKVTRSGFGATEYQYLASHKLQTTNSLGHITTTQYLGYGEPDFTMPVHITAPESVTTIAKRNVFGDIVELIQSGLDHQGNEVSATEYRYYNAQQRLCLQTRQDTGQKAYLYNALGQVTAEQHSAYSSAATSCPSTLTGAKTEYEYDNRGKLQRIAYRHPSKAAVSHRYQYNNNGQLTGLSSDEVNQVYQYNNLGLLEREQTTIGDTRLSLDYAYTPLQTLKSLTYPDGTQLDYAPNAFGQPTKVEAVEPSSGEGYQHFAREVSYYSSGQLQSFHYGNGVEHKQALHFASRLPQSITDRLNGQPLVKLTYQWDTNGNLTSLTDEVAPSYSLQRLEYDGMDRLTRTVGQTSIGNARIEYDGLGNIREYERDNTTLSYAYSEQNRLTQVSTSSGQVLRAFNGQDSYDDTGNVIHNGQHYFAYNAAGQMTDAYTLTPATNTKYTYDGHGRRVKKQTGNDIEYSLYNQQGQLLIKRNQAGETYYLYLGNKYIAQLSDAPLATDTRAHYQAYGESITATTDDIGYTGHKHDKTTGLVYMQARYYDPVIGRFYSNDPVGTMGYLSQGNIQGFNRYNYAYNNPYKYTDPDGRNPLKAATLAADVTDFTADIATGNYLGAAVTAITIFEPTGVASAVRRGIKAMKVASNPVAVKTATEMADGLANKIGKNSVSFKTVDKTGHIDLKGKAHFDKKIQTSIDTPHVQTRDLKFGPEGQVVAPKKTETTRAATKQDVRTAEKLAKKQGLL